MDRVPFPVAVTLLAQGQPVPRTDQLALAHARVRERGAHVGTGVWSDDQFADDAPGDEVLAGDPKSLRLFAQQPRFADDIPVAVRPAERSFEGAGDGPRAGLLPVGREGGLGDLHRRERGAELQEFAHFMRLASVS